MAPGAGTSIFSTSSSNVASPSMQSICEDMVRARDEKNCAGPELLITMTTWRLWGATAQPPDSDRSLDGRIRHPEVSGESGDSGGCALEHLSKPRAVVAQ